MSTSPTPTVVNPSAPNVAGVTSSPRNAIAYTAVNTGARLITATLNVEMSAFHRARHVELRLDGRSVQTLVVQPPRRVYRIGPLLVSPGDHELLFHPAEAPTLAGEGIGNGDPRSLSFAVGAWNWRVGDEQR